MGHETQGRGRPLLAMVAVMLGILAGITVGPDEAEAGVGKELSLFATDGGRVQAPPAGCDGGAAGATVVACSPVAVTCNVGVKPGSSMQPVNTNVSGYVFQNPIGSDAGVRVGPRAVRGYPTPNGVRLAPGESMGWTVSQGVPFVVTEGTSTTHRVWLEGVCELEGF